MRIVPCNHRKRKNHKKHRKHENDKHYQNYRDQNYRDQNLEADVFRFYSSHPLTSPINLNFMDFNRTPKFDNRPLHKSIVSKRPSPIPFKRLRPSPIPFKRLRQLSKVYLTVLSTSILSLPGQLIQFNTVVDGICSNISFDRTQCNMYPRKKDLYQCTLILSLASPTRLLPCSKTTIYLIKNCHTRIGRISVQQGVSKIKRFKIELKPGDTLSCLRSPKDVQAEILNLQLSVRHTKD